MQPFEASNYYSPIIDMIFVLWLRGPGTYSWLDKRNTAVSNRPSIHMTPLQKAEQHDALTNAHLEYHKGLNAYAYFKTHDHAIGEDLVQDTFMKTWLYLVKGGKVELMRAFLYHILNNLIIDSYRKHSTTSLDALLEKGYEPSDDSESNRLFDALDAKALIPIILKLPLKYRRIMNLRYVKDLSIAEIARTVGQSKSTVTVQAHRGLKMLRALYALKPDVLGV